MSEKDNGSMGRRDFTELFIKALEKCPHAIKEEIGGEGLADEIIKGAKKLHEFVYTVSPPNP
jgi:hypothetical protein